jgi:hypothetical protein
MAIIWKFIPLPKLLSEWLLTPSARKRKKIGQEAMDKAMKELDEELEDAREFAFKALEVKAEP